MDGDKKLADRTSICVAGRADAAETVGALVRTAPARVPPRLAPPVEHAAVAVNDAAMIAVTITIPK